MGVRIFPYWVWYILILDLLGFMVWVMYERTMNDNKEIVLWVVCAGINYWYQVRYIALIPTYAQNDVWCNCIWCEVSKKRGNSHFSYVLTIIQAKTIFWGRNIKSVTKKPTKIFFQRKSQNFGQKTSGQLLCWWHKIPLLISTHGTCAVHHPFRTNMYTTSSIICSRYLST